MTSPVFDFKSIRSKLDRQEQKAEFEAKNPKVDPDKVVWSPEFGYGIPVPYSLAFSEALRRFYIDVNDPDGGWKTVEAEV